MNTHYVLEALAEAKAAFDVKPELEAKIKSLSEELELQKLYNEEALDKIALLTTELSSVKVELITTKSELDNVYFTNRDLTSKLDEVEWAYKSANRTIDDLSEIKTNLNLTIQTLELDKKDLAERLENSKSFADRLTDTLKSIGSAITKTVEVPEVTSADPFPVSESVAMPISTNSEESSIGINQSVWPLDEQAFQTVEEPITERFRYWG